MAKKSEQMVGPSEGASTTAAANIAGTPTFVSHDTGAIAITWDENSNSDVCDYLIYVEEDGSPAGYVQADGTVDAGEIWQTFAVWGASVEVTGLTVDTPYKFKVRARDEADNPVDYSALSVTMCTDPGIDYGVQSNNLDRTATGGDTIVDEDEGLVISGTAVPSGEETQSELPEYYGDITVTYRLINDDSTESRVVVEYSENYDPDDETGDWYTATEGSGGDGLTGLNTSAAGKSHTYVWDSYEDSGKSELDVAVYLRITPYDASPTEGDAANAVASDAFAVNNRPGKITWANADGRTFSKDTTPAFIATIPYLRAGTKGYPTLSVYESDGTSLVMERRSVWAIDGWEYEDDTDSWNSLTVAGIPDTVIDGTNRMRYTVQAADALSVDDGSTDYIINGYMGEVQDRG